MEEQLDALNAPLPDLAVEELHDEPSSEREHAIMVRVTAYWTEKDGVSWYLLQVQTNKRSFNTERRSFDAFRVYIVHSWWIIDFLADSRSCWSGSVV
jgi:hypothetical protein